MDNIDSVLFSVDPVIFSFQDDELKVLLVKRSSDPYKGYWGLPGGRVDQVNCNDLSVALSTKLEQKTGLRDVFFEQLATYGGSEMDPRGWSVTTAYLALVHAPELKFIEESKYIEERRWVSLKQLDECQLGFWHRRIIEDATARLKYKSLYTDLPVNLLPAEFTYPMLKHVYEVILDIKISRQSFAKRMDSAAIFDATGQKIGGSNRPSPLYTKKNRGGAHIFPGMIKGN